MRRLELNGDGWTVRATGDLSAVPASLRAREAPARVPGCVHTDLRRAGLIPDLAVGFGEREVQWIGESDFEYRRSFDLPDELLAYERTDLVCDGVDTLAELSLNGAAIGSAANMFHPHRFDLRPALRRGRNELAITFRSPLRHVRAEERRLGPRPYNGDRLGWAPFPFMRKAAVNFGWDFAPRAATSGIWRGIRIEAWSGVRIAGVRPIVRRIDRARWTVDATVELEWSGSGAVPEGLLLGACLRGEPHVDEWDSAAPPLGDHAATLSIGVDDPRLWWPRGSGDQALYGLDVALYDRRSAWGVAEMWSGKIGFREVRLNTEPDEEGSRFQIEVNGTPVFCKGANWVPCGLFPDDRSPERVRDRVRQAGAANMNMLRVWGGGVYEDDAFYRECDRLGIMVWQDFMFACACYPEEPPLPALVEAEARHQITRLSAHPSVVLWCGGNECVWGHEAWGIAEGAPWKERTTNTTWGAGYWFDLLPRLVRELDPTRPYWANSPSSGAARQGASGAEAKEVNSATRGDRHTWDAAPGSSAFRAIAPRFCSEFGCQAPPNLEMLREAVGAEGLVIGSAALEHRQRATGGMARHIDGPLAERFPAPASFEEWHRLAQQLQADSLREAIEWLASQRPRCMGALVWQLNDLWPGMSWSLIDSDGRPKPAYDAVREAFGRITP
jgi:beta-mannosidase